MSQSDLSVKMKGQFKGGKQTDKGSDTDRLTKYLHWFYREVWCGLHIGSKTKVEVISTYENVYGHSH